MPYARLSINVTVPNEVATQSREILEKALDQLIIENIPAYNINVEEECVDPPAGA